MLVPSASVTGFKGVFINGGKYQARVNENGTKRHLGNFATKEEAALSHDGRRKQGTCPFSIGTEVAWVPQGFIETLEKHRGLLEQLRASSTPSVQAALTYDLPGQAMIHSTSCGTSASKATLPVHQSESLQHAPGAARLPILHLYPPPFLLHHLCMRELTTQASKYTCLLHHADSAAPATS